MSVLRQTRAALALLAVAVVVVACSSESSKGSAARTAGTTPSGSPVATAPSTTLKPVELCPSSEELFCARSPHAFVQTGAHGDEVSPLALAPGAVPTAETPVALSGVNLKQGPYRRGGEWTSELLDTRHPIDGIGRRPARLKSTRSLTTWHFDRLMKYSALCAMARRSRA